jgi:hypothetical protein
MKSLLVVIALGLLGTCLTACGSGKDTSSTASVFTPKEAPISRVPTKVPPELPQTKADADKDDDIGAPEDDTNNDSTVDFGHAADASDTRAITALIKRYYAAAYTENGANACKMLYSTLEEAVPEDYGESPPGQPYMRGSTCAAVLTLLFKHVHPQLTIEHPKLEVAHVRLVEHHGIVVLRFGALPERVISVSREGHTWRVDALLDSEVP